MHQGNPVNPWIVSLKRAAYLRLRTDTRDRVAQNYPYLTNPAMKYAADSCHANGMKYSVYGPLHKGSVAHPFLLAAFHSKFIGDCSTLRLSRSLDHFR